jgi:CBS domain-containing protein
LFKRKGFDQLPVVSETGRPVGLVTAGQVFARLASGKVNPDTSVAEVMFRFEGETGKKEKYVPVTKETRLEDLQRFFRDPQLGLRDRPLPERFFTSSPKSMLSTT